MSKSLGDVTSAPVDTTVGGRSYTLSPLMLRDFGRIEQWMRECIITAARQVIRDTPEGERTPDEIAYVMDGAYRETSRVGWMKTPEMLLSGEGALRVLWLSLRKQAPAIGLAELEAEFPLHRQEELSELIAVVMRISGLELTAAEEEEAALAAGKSAGLAGIVQRVGDTLSLDSGPGGVANAAAAAGAQ